MEFFDCHCHTERSACAEDVSLAMYTHIARRGGPAFAITDHSAHLFYPPGKAWSFWGDDARAVFDRHHAAGLTQCAEYVQWLREAQTGNMLVGVELDVFEDGTFVFDEDLLGELDIILGAVHGIRALSQDAPMAEVKREFKTRTLHLCELGVHALVHPFREFKQKSREVPLSLIEWLVETAADTGTALELNCHYQVPECDVPMLRLCAQAQVPIAIATDTHRAHEFGDFSYHREMLDAAGIEAGTWPQTLMGPPTGVLAS